MPPVKDVVRRLQEISTLLQMIKVLSIEPKRKNVVHHLREAVAALSNVPTEDFDPKSRLIALLIRLIARLEESKQSGWDDEITLLYNVIIELVKPPVRYRLQMPTFTDLKGNLLMPTFPLALDKIATFTITEMNTTTNAFDPVPAGDVFTVVNSDTTNLNAVVGVDAAGGPALVVNWVHTVDPLLTGVSVTLSDTSGNTADVQLFDMVHPAAIPDQIGLDITGVVLASQPVPV